MRLSGRRSSGLALTSAPGRRCARHHDQRIPHDRTRAHPSLSQDAYTAVGPEPLPTVRCVGWFPQPDADQFPTPGADRCPLPAADQFPTPGADHYLPRLDADRCSRADAAEPALRDRPRPGPVRCPVGPARPDHESEHPPGREPHRNAEQREQRAYFRAWASSAAPGRSSSATISTPMCSTISTAMCSTRTRTLPLTCRLQPVGPRRVGQLIAAAPTSRTSQRDANPWMECGARPSLTPPFRARLFRAPLFLAQLFLAQHCRRLGPDAVQVIPASAMHLPRERIFHYRTLHYRTQKSIEGHPRTGDPQWKDVRRRPTLPRGGPRSTIGAERLSFRVRNGTGRFPLAMTAVTLLRCQSNYRPYPGNCTVDA
jgi:hypothetical protein